MYLKTRKTDLSARRSRGRRRDVVSAALRRMARGTCLVIVFAGLVARGGSASAAGKDQHALQSLLARLGLVDLQIFQLEQQLKSTGGSAQDVDAARRLADLYAARLMSSADDAARYAELMARVQDLLRRFPKANTTALQVMLLQADYNQAETRIAEWISDPRQTAAKKDAARTLGRITPLLDKYQQTLNQQLEQLTARADSMAEGDALRTLEKQARRLQNVTARATYFAAWASYYLALLQNDPPNGPLYQRARLIFRQLLQIGDQPMSEVKAEWLGLESVWKARALIGLGLAEAACAHADAADTCFGLLENAAVPVPIRDQAAYWHLRALLDSGRPRATIEFARRMLQSFTSEASQGEVSFCVALVRAGYGPPVDQRQEIPAKERAELGKLGLLGLAKLDQLAAVDALLEKYKIPIDDRAGFILLWAQGQQMFGRAEKEKKPSDYAGAARALQAALDSDDAGILPGPAARCRYTLAWCDYRQDRLEEAARQFTRAADGLREAKESRAPEAAWMAFVAYRQLCKKQPELLGKATAALDRIKRDFPNHAYAKRADLELARLLAGTSPDQTIHFLEGVKPSDPNYLSARYELCLLLHQHWAQVKSDGSARSARCKALNQAVDVFLKAAGGGTDVARKKVKVCLLLVDAAARTPDSEPDLAARYLARAAQFAADLDDNDALAAEYHYRALQQATRRGDTKSRQQHAEWLVQHGSGSPYEQAALVAIASALDKVARNANMAQDSKTIQAAYATFRRLVASLGDSPDKLAGNKNSRVALSRLAFYAEQMGRHAEAAELLEKLLVVFPRDRGYLQRAALAAFRANQFGRSLVHWRTLLAGLPRGSQAWLEAKYYQLMCLAKTDKDRARRVFHQFQLLYPDLGGTAWKTKFQQLPVLQ